MLSENEYVTDQRVLQRKYQSKDSQISEIKMICEVLDAWPCKPFITNPQAFQEAICVVVEFKKIIPLYAYFVPWGWTKEDWKMGKMK